MKQYGLIGRTLGHSFSQAYFTDKFAREHIDAAYYNFELPDIDRFPQLLQSHPLLAGLNVTIPYKQVILPYLDRLSPEAAAIGAVNVIRFHRPDKHGQSLQLIGENTDVIGFRETLRPLLQPWHNRALVLGTGGASLAVIHALRQLHIEPQRVSRTPSDGVITYDQLTSDHMAEHTLIINCTPLGTVPDTDRCPPIPYDRLTSRHLLYDLVYNPPQTKFMQQGIAHGATVKSGLDMLHMQALAAWQLWTAPVTAR